MSPNILIVLCLFILYLFPSTFSYAESVQKRIVTIEELTATTSEKHLILFATLKNSFTSEMIEILESGIPLHFTFYIVIKPVVHAGGYKLQSNKK